MSFFRLWLTGYLHPGRAFEALRDKPAPHYGLYGVLLRGLIMGLVWYLPRALIGLRPRMAPVLPFPPVESYYWHALWYFPVFELAKWLLMAAIMHLALRLLRMPTDYDVLLVLFGITALIIDPVIRIWDWIVYAAGWSDNTVLMGAAHALVFWPWGLALASFYLSLILSVVPDGAAAFRGAWRVLRPGGRAVGTVARTVGTDPNRRLSQLIAGAPGLVVERNEPSLLQPSSLGRQYRIVLVRKQSWPEESKR